MNCKLNLCLLVGVVHTSASDFECPDDLNEAVGHILQEVLPEDGNGASGCLDDVCKGLFGIIRQ